MSSSYYDEKIINKNNAYITSKVLTWAIKILEANLEQKYPEEIIDILLNHLSLKYLEVLIEDYYKQRLGEILKNKKDENYDSYQLENIETKLKYCKFDIVSCRYKGDHGHDYEYFLDFLAENWNKSKGQFFKYSIIDKIGQLLKKNSLRIKRDKILNRLSKIKDTFKLSENEISCIVLYYAISYDENYKIILFSATSHYETPNQTLSDRIKVLLNISQSKAEKIFKNKSNLSKYRLLKNYNRSLGDVLVDYLSGFSTNHLNTLFYKEYSGDSLPLKAHSIRQVDNKILRRIIKNKGLNQSCNILLFGAPGSGKTEYIRSIANNLNYILYEINSSSGEDVYGDSQDNREFNRYTAFIACENTISQKNSIILIDEADEMLNGGNAGATFGMFGGSSRNTEKNKINELLDNSTTVNIWITNHSANIDESTRRRFDYSIEFEKFDFRQRLNVWKTVLNKYDLTTEFPKKEIEQYAERYEFNAGGIEIVLKNYKRMPKKTRNEETLKLLIDPHLKLMNISNNANNENKHLRPVKNYSLEGLNIKGEHSISDGLEIITEFSNFMKTAAYKESEMKNMNLLLHGPSGTGKTEFVKYMAKEAGRELLFKSGSDFLGMYVGQTEQNIKNIFREAEKKNAILFIDEADGLLYDRSKSSKSFEMSQVNEMLIQIENFNGILVCSSNFQKNMDSATYRRFNLKFEFDYLTSEGNSIFYKTILESLINTKLSDDEKKSIASIKGLTPGDFKVVKQKYYFFNKKKISHHFLIKALKEEVRYKDIGMIKKFGFRS